MKRSLGAVIINTSFGTHGKEFVVLHNLAHQGAYIKMEELCILATNLKYL